LLASRRGSHSTSLERCQKFIDTSDNKESIVSDLPQQVLTHAASLPEGASLCAKALLHLGSRAAVDQALSRLARGGALLRVGRGVYVLPVRGRFGARAPEVAKVVQEWANQRGEIVVGNGAAAANALGLTTQVPVRQVFLTSGPSRKLKLGSQTVELRHAPPWQLLFPGQAAGEVIRSLAWVGPSRSEAALGKLRRKLPASQLQAIANARMRLPAWLASQVSALVALA
jgi:hypothetical protein